MAIGIHAIVQLHAFNIPYRREIGLALKNALEYGTRLVDIARRVSNTIRILSKSAGPSSCGGRFRKAARRAHLDLRVGSSAGRRLLKRPNTLACSPELRAYLGGQGAEVQRKRSSGPGLSESASRRLTRQKPKLARRWGRNPAVPPRPAWSRDPDLCNALRRRHDHRSAERGSAGSRKATGFEGQIADQATKFDKDVASKRRANSGRGIRKDPHYWGLERQMGVYPQVEAIGMGHAVCNAGQ